MTETTTTTIVRPPEELSPRVVPRSQARTAPEYSRRGAIHAQVIDWHRLVVAAWQLPADDQYTGVLPEGLSAQQFWARATTAARKRGGRVGVETHGRRWWVWSVERGTRTRLRDRESRWKTLWQTLAEAGEARLSRALTAAERKSLRELARRKGRLVRFAKDDAGTVVTVAAEEPTK